MLEKNSENDKIIYCDAHFHLADCIEKNCFDSDMISCSCFHSKDEWNYAVRKPLGADDEANPRMIHSFGIHPKNPDLSMLSFLEELLESKKIQAIGECGFDFFHVAPKVGCEEQITASPKTGREEQITQTQSTGRKGEDSAIQTEAFLSQIALAKKYNLPVVIHCRKANEKLFEYSSELKKLPAVLFHSFMGTVTEANSLLNRGINGYFSFGKQIFNGNKKVIQCVKELPIERLLLETDAPFQTLKGEEKTFTSEIRKIYEGAFKLRFDSVANDVTGFFDFAEKLKRNFTECFCNPL